MKMKIIIKMKMKITMKIWDSRLSLLNFDNQ